MNRVPAILPVERGLSERLATEFSTVPALSLASVMAFVLLRSAVQSGMPSGQRRQAFPTGLKEIRSVRANRSRSLPVATQCMTSFSELGVPLDLS